ncbi:MAG: hypothetical protein AAFU49_24315 [Pseudomonadota bacterium]
MFGWTSGGDQMGWADGDAVQVFDPASGGDLGRIAAPGPVSALAFSRDAKSMWVGTTDGTVVRVSMLDRSEKARFSLGAEVRELIAGPDDAVLARASGPYRLWTADGVSRSLAAELAGAEGLSWSDGLPVSVPRSPLEVDGVGRIGDRLLIILDLDALFGFLEREV